MTLLDFERGQQTHVDAKGLVVGIDFSDLGYEPGETFTRLTLLETGDGATVDPVLIVGLPEE